MGSDKSYIRHGIGSVRPYIYGRLDLLDLVTKAFGAIQLERHEMGPKACHYEGRIGDSVIVIEAGDPPHASGRPAAIYVFVEDVDAAYRQAIAAGATSITAPEDKPYEERAAALRDSYGNIWYIATYTGAKPGSAE